MHEMIRVKRFYQHFSAVHVTLEIEAEWAVPALSLVSESAFSGALACHHFKCRLKDVD
jgi:hypothetical protein